VPFREAVDCPRSGHISKPGYGLTPPPVKDRLPLCYSAVLKIFTLVPNLVDTSSFFHRLEILDRFYTWKKREDLERISILDLIRNFKLSCTLLCGIVFKA
jgi:hypothetical protein